jgi:hypothetical protein
MGIAITIVLSPNYRWSEQEVDHPYGSDFLQEWIGGRMLLTGHGGELYNVQQFAAWQHAPENIGFRWNEERFYPPVYPPIHYALFAPWSLLPYRWAVLLWMGLLWVVAFISVGMIAVIGREETASQADSDSTWHRWLPFLWIPLVLFPPVLLSIQLGQKSLLWLLILCITYRLLRRRSDWKAGVVFGLMSLKPTLFFLLPLFMLRHGRWRFCAGAGITVGLLWGAGFLLLPNSMWRGYWATLHQVTHYASHVGYRSDWACNVLSLADGFRPDWVAWGKLAICAPLALYVVLCVFQPPQQEVSLMGLLSVCLGTFLLAPHAYQYDLTLLLLPILGLSLQSVRPSWSRYAVLAICITLAATLWDAYHIPILPVALLGMLSVHRCRNQPGVFPGTLAGNADTPWTL